MRARAEPATAVSEDISAGNYHVRGDLQAALEERQRQDDAGA
jgi:hypothetical protein